MKSRFESAMEAMFFFMMLMACIVLGYAAFQMVTSDFDKEACSCNMVKNRECLPMEHR
mgnify:CR=1 FL=1